MKRIVLTLAGSLVSGLWSSAALPADRTLPLRTVVDVPLSGGSSRLDYESLDPKRNLLFIAHLGASQLIVVDTKRHRVVKTISDVSNVHGVLAVPELNRVYASVTGTNEVAIIDEKSLQVVARVPAGTYPDGMAFAPKQHKLYVSDEHGDTDTVIDTNTNHRVATIALGGDVGNTQYDPRTHHILVNVQTRGELVAIDPSADGVVARYPISGCKSNHGLLIDDRHRLAYIACEDNATLVVFDLRKLSQKQTVPIGRDPDVLAYDDGRSTLYVASESGTVTMLDATNDGVRKIAEGFLAENAHVVAVDERTHRVYFPLLEPNGTPLLRVMEASPSR
jgi:YVTN family beta-propeller protein